MKNVQNISRGTKHSIKGEAVAIILPLVVLAILIVAVVGYSTSKRQLSESIDMGMNEKLSSAVQTMETYLTNNSLVAENIARATENVVDISDKERYADLLATMISTNEPTFGGGIWFEPYAYNEDQHYLSPYCCRENGKITYYDDYSLGDGVYYTDQEWYKSAKGIKTNTVWTAPYYDDCVKLAMVTASAPFYDKDGKFLGVATTDIDLTGMQTAVTALASGKREGHLWLTLLEFI